MSSGGGVRVRPDKGVQSTAASGDGVRLDDEGGARAEGVGRVGVIGGLDLLDLQVA